MISSQINSTQLNTHIQGVWKTLCSSSMEPLSSKISSLFSHSTPCSICIHISALFRGRETWDSPLTNLLLLLPADGLAHSIEIFSSLVGDLHTHSSGRTPVLLFVSQWKFTHAIINPEGTQQCQAWALLINRSWKRGLHLFFFLHNYCLFGIGGEAALSYFWRHVFEEWSTVLMGRCYCQDDTFICVQKIDGVFYKLFVFLFWLTEVCVQGALKSQWPQGVCRQVCAMYGSCLWFMCVQFGISLCGQLWSRDESSDMPPVRWCLSATCWNSTGFSVQPVWTDKITRHKHGVLGPPDAVVCEFLSWSDLDKGKKDNSPKSLFVFCQNHICHCF